MIKRTDIKKVEIIRDINTIARSFITATNGILALVLTAIAGTIDIDDKNSNIMLRNLSITFGAIITGLHILLAFGIDVLIAKNTNGIDQENILRKMLESDTVSGKIQKGNEMLGRVIVEIKKIKEQIPGEEKKKFEDQINALEDAYGPLGTGIS